MSGLTNRSHPVYEISESDMDSTLGSHALIMASGHDQINELSMLHNDCGSVSPDSPQDILRD